MAASTLARKVAPKILEVPREEGPPPARAVPELGWRVLSIVGVAFALVGAVDLALTWYPASFGNPEWEFATVTSTLDSLPVTVIGLGALLSGAVAVGRIWPVRILSMLFFTLGLVVLTMALLYATDVPLALR